MRNNRSSATRGIASGIFLIGLALAFLGGGFNLPIFFIALAFAELIGSMSSRTPQVIYGGIQGFFWLLTLAIFFITGSWIVFLLAAGISAILGTMARPIIAGLTSMAFFGTAQPSPQQYEQAPQPSYQPAQQPYQSYQEGYRPPETQPETYQEGNQHYPYPLPSSQQYEQPQAQYPQQIPPQQ